MRTAAPTTDVTSEPTREDSAPESRRRRTCDRKDCVRVSSQVNVHGLAKVGEERGCTVRRIIWIVILLCGLILFGSAAVERVLHFLSRPTLFSYKIAHAQDAQSEQPTITICNLNRFRLSEVRRRNWLISDTDETPVIDPDISSRQLHIDAAHRLDEMLVRCRWGHRECSHVNFRPVPTEDGQCYTFIGHGVSRIELTLDVQLDESITQRWTGVGVKVKVHDHQEHPLFTDPSITVPPGADATILVERRKMKLLPPPYGDCDENAEFRSACMALQKSDYVRRKCGCTPFWVSNYLQGMPPFCTLTEDVTCVQEKTDEYQYTVEKTACPVPCMHVRYYSSVSYTSLAKDSATVTLQDETHKETQDTTMNIRTLVKPDDTSKIREVIRSADAILTAFAQLQENFTAADMNVFQIVDSLQPRVDFHLRIGLGGIKRTIELDFTDGWFAIEDASLKPLVTQLYRTLSYLDRSIRTLRKTPLSETAVRKVLYLVTENELSTMVELASRAVDNVTAVHYAYLNADPLIRVAVTPNRRYDSALVPYRLISHDTAQQTRYYNQISDHLAGYVQQVMALKGVLLDAFASNRPVNESLYRIAAGKFVQHSQDINYFRWMFRREIVLQSAGLIEKKIEDFRQKNYTMHVSRRNVVNAISRIQRLLQRHMATTREQLGPFLRSGKRRKLTSRQAQSIRMASQTAITDTVPALYDLVTELKWQCLRLTDVWRSVFAAAQELWIGMLDEEILRNFYFELHKDAADMLRNRTNTQFYLDMFLHETMLDVPNYRRSGLTLADVVARLNADLATTEKERKFSELAQLEHRMLRVTTYAVSEMLVKVKVLHRTLQDLRKLSAELDDRTSVTKRGSDTVSDGVIHLSIYLDNDIDDVIEQTPSYPLTELLGDLGGLLALFLGASIITLFEITDLLFRSVPWRTSKNHSSFANRSPNVQKDVTS